MWTEERIEYLKKSWEAGISAQAIARHLKAGGFEVTRNAVIGAANRRGFKTPRAPGMHDVVGKRMARVVKEANVSAAKKRRAALAVYGPPAPPPNCPTMKPMMERQPNECAWPVWGEGVGLYMCCAPRWGAASYCATHLDMSESGKKIRPLNYDSNHKISASMTPFWSDAA